MPVLNIERRKVLLDTNKITAWGIGLCYAFGILNTAHYMPYPTFFGGGLATAILAAILMVTLYLSPLHSIALSSLTWLSLALVIAIQSSFNNIIYTDSLIFPVVALLLITILSAQVYNLENKPLFIQHLAVIMLFAGLITVVIQGIQLTVSADNLPWGVSKLAGGQGPYGNLNQRNVAAYVLSMTTVALFFVYYRWRLSIIWLLLGLFILAVGNAMTGSRGGVILLAVALIIMVFFAQKKDKKIQLFILVIVTAILGYQLGAWLVNLFLESSSGIERLQSGTIYHRLSLLNQAWLIFQEHLLTGVGWGNFNSGGLEHAENIRWFIYAHHAHSVFPQIAAELGLLGLLATLPVVTVILLSIRLTLPIDKLFAFTIVILTGLYSFSEFPLWFFYFLALSAACIACLDSRVLWKLKKGTSLILAIFALLTTSGAIYYLNKYYDIARTVSLVANKDISRQIRLQAYKQQENIFGYSDAKESLTFQLLAISGEQLIEKITFGERVVRRSPQPNNLMRLAQLYTLNKDSRALNLFKAACLYDEGRYCDKVNTAMKELAKEHPDDFLTVSKQYFEWFDNQQIVDEKP